MTINYYMPETMPALVAVITKILAKEAPIARNTLWRHILHCLIMVL